MSVSSYLYGGHLSPVSRIRSDHFVHGPLGPSVLIGIYPVIYIAYAVL